MATRRVAGSAVGRGGSAADDKLMVEKLRAIQRANPDNKKCADCGDFGPTYVCMDFGSFICTTCSGLHREINHKVKGVSLSSWKPVELEFIAANGNTKCAEKYLATYSRETPPPEPNQIERLRLWIRAKYDEKRWVAASSRPRSLVTSESKSFGIGPSESLKSSKSPPIASAAATTTKHGKTRRHSHHPASKDSAPANSANASIENPPSPISPRIEKPKSSRSSFTKAKSPTGLSNTSGDLFDFSDTFFPPAAPSPPATDAAQLFSSSQSDPFSAFPAPSADKPTPPFPNPLPLPAASSTTQPIANPATAPPSVEKRGFELQAQSSNWDPFSLLADQSSNSSSRQIQSAAPKSKPSMTTVTVAPLDPPPAAVRPFGDSLSSDSHPLVQPPSIVAADLATSLAARQRFAGDPFGSIEGVASMMASQPSPEMSLRLSPSAPTSRIDVNDGSGGDNWSDQQFRTAVLARQVEAISQQIHHPVNKDDINAQHVKQKDNDLFPMKANILAAPSWSSSLQQLQSPPSADKANDHRHVAIGGDNSMHCQPALTKVSQQPERCVDTAAANPFGLLEIKGFRDQPVTVPPSDGNISDFTKWGSAPMSLANSAVSDGRLFANPTAWSSAPTSPGGPDNAATAWADFDAMPLSAENKKVSTPSFSLL